MIVVSRKWYIRYRLDGEQNWMLKPLGVTDSQVANKLLVDFRREREQEAAGIISPLALRNGAVKLLADHLNDLEADLRAKGRAPMYVYNVRKHCERLFDKCGWKLPRDVTSDGFMAWRSGNAGLAAKTHNEYLNSINGLLNWMQRHGRLLTNPLRSIEKVDTRGREVRRRRALTVAEVRRLLALESRFRAVYGVALATGLRRNELSLLRWGDVHLDALRPFVQVRAGIAKNRRTVNLPLLADVVPLIRAVRPVDADLGHLVFPKMPTMEEYRADLEAAGIVHEEDSEGRSSRSVLRTDTVHGPSVSLQVNSR